MALTGPVCSKSSLLQRRYAPLSGEANHPSGESRLLGYRRAEAWTSHYLQDRDLPYNADTNRQNAFTVEQS
jgi:hypothetical protein